MIWAIVIGGLVLVGLVAMVLVALVGSEPPPPAHLESKRSR